MTEKIGLEAILLTSEYQKGVEVYISGQAKLVSTTTKTSKTMNSFTKGVVQGLGIGLTNLASKGVQSVVQGFNAIVSEGQQFAKSMSNVAALTGAVGNEFTSLENTAKTLGKTTKFTATEASEGMAFLAQAGFETNEIIQAMPGTLNLAAATNLGLGKSADIVSNILKGFGASAESTGQFVDVLTKTFTTSNTNLVQLGNAMKQVAPIAKNLGISVGETSAAIGVLGDAGIQGFKAGTGLRGILTTLTKTSGKAKTGMDELGVSVFDASGNMRSMPEIIGQFEAGLAGMTVEQRQAALSTIFNQKQIAAFSILLEKGQSGLQAYGDSVRDNLGVASEIATKQLDNLAGDVTLFQSALSGLQLTIFDEMEQGLRTTTQAMTDLTREADLAVTGLSRFGESIGIIITGLVNLTGQQQESVGLFQSLNVAIGATAGGLTNFTGAARENITATEALNNAWRFYQKVAEIAIDKTAQQGIKLLKLTVSEEKLGKAFTVAGGAIKQQSAKFNTLSQRASVLNEVYKKARINAVQLAKAELEVNEAARLAQQSSAIYSTKLEQQEKAALDATIAQSQLNAAMIDFGDFGLEAGIASTSSTIAIEQLRASIEAQRVATRQLLDDNVDEIATSAASSTANSIKDAFGNIKGLIGQVSGLTFSELLPPQETFRVDEWVRRLQAVANDGSNQWAQAAVDTFGGQAFIQPLADAIATGDPGLIANAAQEIINGPNLFMLMDVEGAADQVEILIQQQELGQRVDNAIAQTLAQRGTIPQAAIGGDAIVQAAGLGPDVDLTSPIQSAVQDKDIPGLITTALNESIAQVGGVDGESPLVTLLGLGPGGALSLALETFSTSTLPLLGEAFTLLLDTVTPISEEILFGIQTNDEAIVFMSDTTVPNLDTSFTTASSNINLNLAAILLSVQKIDNAFLKIIKPTLPQLQSTTKLTTDNMIKQMNLVTSSIGMAIDETKKLKGPLESALKVMEKMAKAADRIARGLSAAGGIGGGGGANIGASQGIGGKAHASFQKGTLGFQVPPGFQEPNNPFRIDTQSGERVIVSPRGQSIEQFAGINQRPNVNMDMTFNVSNNMDLEMTRQVIVQTVEDIFQ